MMRVVGVMGAVLVLLACSESGSTPDATTPNSMAGGQGDASTPLAGQTATGGQGAAGGFAGANPTGGSGGRGGDGGDGGAPAEAMGGIGAACGDGTGTTLTDLGATRLTATVQDLDEFAINVDFPGALQDPAMGCPALGSKISATINGLPLDVLSCGGIRDCQGLPGPTCGKCDRLRFRLKDAWRAPKADGTISVAISDASLTIIASAAKMLYPSGIALETPAANMVTNGDPVVLLVDARVPPVTSLDLTVSRPIPPNRIESILLGGYDVQSGRISFTLRGAETGPAKITAATDTATSPQALKCEGVASCVFTPTKRFGAIDVVISD